MSLPYPAALLRVGYGGQGSEESQYGACSTLGGNLNPIPKRLLPSCGTHIVNPKR
jgi:hypothetical protein